MLIRSSDLFLLHRFQQSRLRFGWSPVDFIGQQHIGENRPFDETEALAPTLPVDIQNLSANDVRGHQIRGELNPFEMQIENLSQSAHHQSLSQTRQTNHQAVTASRNRNQQLLGDLLLTNNDFTEFTQNRGTDITHCANSLNIKVGNTFR